jgi:hypothetical protein
MYLDIIGVRRSAWIPVVQIAFAAQAKYQTLRLLNVGAIMFELADIRHLAATIGSVRVLIRHVADNALRAVKILSVCRTPRRSVRRRLVCVDWRKIRR